MGISQLDLDRVERFHEAETREAGQPAIIFYSPNTYHYTLLNVHHLEESLFQLHQINGIVTAEISEDVFGIVPMLTYHKNPQPVNQLADRIMKLEEETGVKVLSIGTGADFYSVQQLAGGYYDSPDGKRPGLWQLFVNFIRVAEYLGVSKINGHRVVTIQPERFESIRLGDFGARIGREKLNLGGVDPDTILGGAEAKSLELALMLQEASDSVSSTTELMYQEGMEPGTIDQMERFLHIMQANSEKPVTAHMDTGHVAAYGKDKKKEDYDIMEYASIRWPRWIAHFNALYRNEHRMPTDENIAADLFAREEKPDPVKSPHPELYGNVYDWLKETALNSRIIQVSPEPKPTEIKKLIREVGECWMKLKMEFSASHKPHPKYGGILIPNGLYDAFIKNFG